MYDYLKMKISKKLSISIFVVVLCQLLFFVYFVSLQHPDTTPVGDDVHHRDLMDKNDFGKADVIDLSVCDHVIGEYVELSHIFGTKLRMNVSVLQKDYKEMDKINALFDDTHFEEIDVSIVGDYYIIQYELFPLKFRYFTSGSLKIVVRKATITTCRTINVFINSYPVISTFKDIITIPGYINPELNLEETLILMQVFRNHSTIAPGEDMLTQGSFDKCAIVGASGILKGSSLGEEIDSNDIVIRMNKPYIEGYEKDVGKKTNIIFSNPWVDLMDLDEHIKKNVHIYYQLTVNWQVQSYIENIEKVSKRQNVYITNPYLLSTVDMIVNRYRLKNQKIFRTTGMIAILSSLRSCKTVRAYGFGKDPKGYDHYYDDKPRVNKDWDGHDYDAEAVIRKVLREMPEMIQPWYTWGIGTFEIANGIEFVS